MEDCKYRLSYIDKDYKVTVEFTGEQCVSSLKYNLRYFLLSCSWLPQQVDEMLGADE